jgi:hypothetical protein
VGSSEKFFTPRFLKKAENCGEMPGNGYQHIPPGFGLLQNAKKRPPLCRRALFRTGKRIR